MSEKSQEKWTETQIRYINFLGRRKKTKSGAKSTNEKFAEAHGINPSTLYDWKKLPGFKLAVLEAMVAEDLDDLGDMLSAMKAEAKGVEIRYTDSKGKTRTARPNVNAFRELTKAWGLAVDRVDHTTDGERLPATSVTIVNNKSDDELDAIIKSATGA